jgi:hypothetical protein
MLIEWELGHELADKTRRPSKIEITLEPDDDPDGYIVGLLMQERLGDFLSCFANTRRFPAADKLEAREVLMHFAYVASHCAGRLEMLQLAARYQFGLGWGTIANAVEGSRSTVRDQILAARERAADRGWWWDDGGLNHSDPATARTAAKMMDIVRGDD